MKNNQKGFSAVEVIIIVVIVVLVGAVGWLVYDKQKGQDSIEEVTTETTQQEDQETPISTDVVVSTEKKSQPSIDIVSSSDTSPGGTYVMRVEHPGDTYSHTLTDKSGEVILKDYIFAVSTLPGYGEDWGGLVGGPEFKGWASDDYFVLELRAPSMDGEKLLYYRMAAESKTGEIVTETFELVKTE